MKCFAMAAVFLTIGTSFAQLSMTKYGNYYVVESSAAPTWKVKIDSKMGAIIRYVYIPASSTVSIVEGDEAGQCCAGLGIDNLEWRYIESGTTTKGIRAPISSAGGSMSVVSQASSKIVLSFTGSGWNCTKGSAKTITILPNRIVVDVTVNFNCATNTKSMWWLISLFKAQHVDCGAVKIRDKDTSPVSLKYCEGTCSLPGSVTMPYQISFPLKSKPIADVVLEVAAFAGDQRNYELWDTKTNQPGDKYNTFYPRWLGTFSKIKYSFTYGWRFDNTGIGSFKSISDKSVSTGISVPAVCTGGSAESPYDLTITAGEIRVVPRLSEVRGMKLTDASGRILHRAGPGQPIIAASGYKGILFLQLDHSLPSKSGTVHRISMQQN